MEAERREKILHTHVDNPTWSAIKIAKTLKFAKSTVYDVLKRFRERKSVDRVPQNKRRSGTYDRKLNQKVLRTVRANPGLSDNEIAQKYAAARSTVRRIRLRAGYHSYRASKQPNRTLKQSFVTKTRARKLYQQVLTKYQGCLLIDDETYVKMDFGQLPGQKFYMATARGNVPAKFKFAFMDKFAKKLMIWQGICSCGAKTKVFVTNKTMDSKLYKEECLKNRVLPFIKAHKGPVKFWPDLASCHYSREVIQWYRDNNIDFIDRNINPPNCPQFRPIERFWAIMKRKLKKSGNTARDATQMTKMWNKYAKEVDSGGVQRMMGGIKKKVRIFIRNEEK